MELCEITDEHLNIAYDIYFNTYYRHCDIIKFLNLDDYLFGKVFVSMTLPLDIRVNSELKLKCLCCNKYKYPSEFLLLQDKVCYQCKKDKKLCRKQY